MPARLLRACTLVAAIFGGAAVQSDLCEVQEACSAVAMFNPRPRFALFGDSLTQQSFDLGGWGASLACAYQRKADIVLRGYSGYNTRWALHTLDKNFPVDGPTYKLATIFFGANDAALPDRQNARQHVPVAEYKSNLATMVDRLQQLGATVILITPPPVDEEGRIKLAMQWGTPKEQARAERTLDVAGAYAAAVRELGGERRLAVLDLWTQLQQIPNWQGLLSDGLHFKPEGNQAVYKLLTELIQEKLPELSVDALPLDFPLHADIDEANPAATFSITPVA